MDGTGNVLQNEANEFFIGFGKNACPCIKERELIISVTTSSQDTVGFTVDTLLDFTYNGTVSLSSPANVRIPPNFNVTDDSTSQRQKGIHLKVEGNKTVAVFGMNRGDQSTDAYLALPCNRLPVVEYEYLAVTYEFSYQSYKPFVLLVGCENSTTITTAVSKFTLNRLETYLMIDAKTGTRVVTDKPIAFFSGHQCSSLSYYGSHLVEQLPPTSTWGTFFLGSAYVATYTVLAARDETMVTVNCNSSSAKPSHFTISTKGTYQNITVGRSPSFCVIETNSPVLVVEIQSNSDAFGHPASSMSLLPPADQYNNNYFLPFGDVKCNYNHYVTISVLPQYFDRKNIYVDSSIPSTNWRSVKCSNGTICAYATTVSAVKSVKHLDSDATIGVILFEIGWWDAYGCPAGFHIRSINPLVSSSTAAPTSSARTLLSTLQPVLTSKAPQPTYLSTLHFHTLHTVLPSTSISPEPAGSMTPELPSVTLSFPNSEHTTVYQRASLTPSVSPADPHPIAVGLLLETIIPAVVVVIIAGIIVSTILVYAKSRCKKQENESLLNEESEDPAEERPILPPCGDPEQRPESTHRANEPLDEEFGDLVEQLPSSVHNPEQRPEPADNIHRDEAVQSRRLTEDDLFHLNDMLRPAAPKWLEIGDALGIANSDLTIIENHPMLIPKGVPGYFREMLSTWLKWAPPNPPWPTIQDLVDAVRRSGHEDLAVKLQNYK